MGRALVPSMLEIENDMRFAVISPFSASAPPRTRAKMLGALRSVSKLVGRASP